MSFFRFTKKPSVIKFAILLTFAALGVLYIIKVMGSFFINTQGVKSQIKTDLKRMSTELEEVVDQLSPWEDKDLDLLSVEQVDLKKKPGLHTQFSGVLSNIYHEKIVAFSYKEYYHKKKKSILVARTSAHNFSYKITKKAIEIFRDNVYLGTLKANGSFFQENTIIAHVDQSRTMSLIPISIHGKQVASLVNPTNHAHKNARALKLIEELSDDDRELLLSLSIFELINRSLI
jgi:hypothetical protein